MTLIKREYVDPPDRGEEELPQVAAAEPSPPSEPPGFRRPLHCLSWGLSSVALIADQRSHT
jgi:hypothetical protein